MEDDESMSNAARRLLARKCYCEYCKEHQERARTVAGQGPKAVLQSFANPTGIICSGVDAMMAESLEALNPTP